MSEELNKILLSWLNTYGEIYHAKKHGNECLVIPIKERKHLLRHLVKTLIDKGYTEENFVYSIKERIVKECFPPEEAVHDKASRKRGISAAIKELNLVLNEFFGVELSRADKPSKSEQIIKKESDDNLNYREFKPSLEKRLGDDLSASKSDDSKNKPNTTIDPFASKLLGFDDE